MPSSLIKCPACLIPLKEITAYKLIADICSQCRGMWFDHGEFSEFLKKLSEHSAIASRTPPLFEQRAPTAPNPVEPLLHCPRCHHNLAVTNYAVDSNIFINRCSQCLGLWAEFEEAKKIAKYLKLNPVAIEIVRQRATKSELIELLDDLCYAANALKAPRAIRLVLPLQSLVRPIRFPAITLGIIVLCIASFVLSHLYILDWESLIKTLGIIPAQIAHAQMLFTLISATFLHGNLMHLIGNMWFLWVFGETVEGTTSRIGYLTAYLLFGVAAGLAYAWMNSSSTTPAIGASGAISGVLGAYLVLYPSGRIKTFFFNRIARLPAFLYLGFWIFFQCLYAFVDFLAGGSSRIGWVAHIGGFVAGGLWGYVKKRAL